MCLHLSIELWVEGSRGDCSCHTTDMTALSSVAAIQVAILCAVQDTKKKKQKKKHNQMHIELYKPRAVEKADNGLRERDTRSNLDPYRFVFL